MIEYLSAVAEGVIWDRAIYARGVGNNLRPDNFLASAAALVKRGLIEYDPDYKRPTDGDDYEWNNYRLTEAGHAVVGLLKLAGIFVEQDAAISKKAKQKGKR